MGAAVRRFDLLAKAVRQSTSMLNDRPPSRASRIVAPPLPQGFGSYRKIKPPADPTPALRPAGATDTASASMQRRCPGC
ncbi:hypothetical protein CUN63_11905 [Pseudomonas sp. ACM7]|nr:hypothetical protein CUN63_11905 [Pseudomonas sp. ACM7]